MYWGDRAHERCTLAHCRWGTMASPMGPILVDSDTTLLLGGLPEPPVKKNLFATGPISPIVDQSVVENCRVGPPTPDPHGHLEPWP